MVIDGLQVAGVCEKHGNNIYKLGDREFLCSVCAEEKEKVFSVKKKNNDKEKKIQKNLNDFNLPFFDEMKWENLKILNERHRKIVDGLRSYSMGVRQWKNLVLWGHQGTGKTLMSYLIGIDLIKSGHSVFRRKANDLLLEIEGMRSNRNSVSDFIKSIYKKDLIILDEIGRHNKTQTTKDIFFGIIDNAIEMKKKIILISNLSISENYTKKNNETLITDFIDLSRIKSKDNWLPLHFDWRDFRS